MCNSKTHPECKSSNQLCQQNVHNRSNQCISSLHPSMFSMSASKNILMNTLINVIQEKKIAFWISISYWYLVLLRRPSSLPIGAWGRSPAAALRRWRLRPTSSAAPSSTHTCTKIWPDPDEQKPPSQINKTSVCKTSFWVLNKIFWNKNFNWPE